MMKKQNPFGINTTAITALPLKASCFRVFVLVSLVSCLVIFLSLKPSHTLWKRRLSYCTGMKPCLIQLNAPSNETVIKKDLQWQRCLRLIHGTEKPSGQYVESFKTGRNIYNKYNNKTCQDVQQKEFVHPVPSEMEFNFPIAYGIVVYKGLPLLERLLKAIYMPQNVYCIHIDKKTNNEFYEAVKKMISCLPNVFIASKPIGVQWGRLSIIEAELSCVADLDKSLVQWKYYINLVGQDFPLYNNYGIVQAMKTLNGYNNINSTPMPSNNMFRIQFVHHGLVTTRVRKSPPPHNIKIMKGSVHVIVTRAFAKFILHSQLVKDFLKWSRDVFMPDEIFFASLQTHPSTPDGIQGNQPNWIARAKHWLGDGVCHGHFIRSICWIDIKDLRWVLDPAGSKQLFVNKIPFEYETDLVDCLVASLQRRKYPKYKLVVQQLPN